MLGAMRYVALGDSYTIGTSVAVEERWPNQLVGRLAGDASSRTADPPLELVGNPAVNGFTSRDVIRLELPQLGALRPDLVSLLIGTNDTIQGIVEEAYRGNLEAILDDVVGRVAAPATLPVGVNCTRWKSCVKVVAILVGSA